MRWACLALLALVACGSDATTAPTQPQSTTVPPSATVTPSPTTTSTTAATTTPSTTVAADTSTTAATPRVREGALTLPPTGEVVAGTNDLFILHTDGDLWLHPGVLDNSPAAPMRLADLTDARIPSGPEGSGPNVVEDVAGEVDGVVYYSDCCEPISGDLLAATRKDSERILVYAGYSPALNPDRTQLATVNNMELAVIDLSSGDYEARVWNETQLWIEPADLIWTADGEALIVLDFADAQWRLIRFSATAPFDQDEPVQLNVPFDPMANLVVQFAGQGPHGEIGVVVGDETATALRFLDPTTLAELPELERSLPPGARSVRIADDGVGLLWIEGTALRYLPAGGEPVDLGDGYAAAWFA